MFINNASKFYIKIDHIIRLLNSYDIKLLLRISQLFSLITYIIGHFLLNLQKGIKSYWPHWVCCTFMTPYHVYTRKMIQLGFDKCLNKFFRIQFFSYVSRTYVFFSSIFFVFALLSLCLRVHWMLSTYNWKQRWGAAYLRPWWLQAHRLFRNMNKDSSSNKYR